MKSIATCDGRLSDQKNMTDYIDPYVTNMDKKNRGIMHKIKI